MGKRGRLRGSKYTVGFKVTVWSPPSDVSVVSLIMCTIDSGHLEALYGGKEGSKEAVLV